MCIAQEEDKYIQLLGYLENEERTIITTWCALNVFITIKLFW